LIIAILSDHHPSELSSQLSEIRDQLAILEAAFVPDSTDDEPSTRSAPSTSDEPSASASTSSGFPSYEEEEEDAETPGLGLALREMRLEGNGQRGGILKVSTANGPKRTVEDGEQIIRSKSSSGSSGSPVEGDGTYLEELELLQSLFPAM
jgi:hypothetical protein